MNAKVTVELKTKEEADFIQEICDEMVSQFKAKNIAYGDSFGKQFEKYGPISALVRLNDKFSRVESLIMGAENNVKDERLQDTLVDMACYSLMTLYELKCREDKNYGD